MEITSFGLASKAASDLKRIRKDMGSNVTSSYANVKERLDQVEKDIEAAYKLTDEIIVNNAINIAKAEAKVNTIANATKFDFEQMIFDDLFDLNGIDIENSSGYTHDSSGGTIIAEEECIIKTKEVVTGIVPSKVLLNIEAYKSSKTLVNIFPNLSLDSTGYTISSSVEDNSFLRLFDGNISSELNAPNYVSNGWVRVALPSPKKAISFSVGISGFNWSVGCAPSSVTLKGKNANTGVWTELATYTTSSWRQNETKTFTINNPINCSEYELNVPNTNGYRNGYTTLHFSEWQIFAEQHNEGEKITGTYSISRDNGDTWEAIKDNTLFYFNSISPQDNKLCIKIELPVGTQLSNYAIMWSE